MASLEAFAVGAARYGLEIELISGNVLRDSYPWLGPAVTGASLCRSDGQANPRLVAPAFAVAARRAGALMHEHEAVAGATRGAEGFHVETDRPPRHRAAARERRRRLGRGRRRLVRRACAPRSAIAQHAGDRAAAPPADVNIGVAGGDVYARQIPRGNLIFGGGRGWNDFASIRSRAGQDSTVGAMARLLDILPWARDAHVIRTWSGIEGFLPDGIPVIGPSATTPGLIHAFGFCGHGFQLGPAVGEMLAELALSGVGSVPIGDFSIRRFANGAPAGRPRGVTETGGHAGDNEQLQEGGTR